MRVSSMCSVCLAYSALFLDVAMAAESCVDLKKNVSIKMLKKYA